jgi:tyrosine phenol-lyase
VVVYEGLHTYGGMAGRDMEAMARGIVESVQDDHMRARIGQVEYLGEQLHRLGHPGGAPHRRPRGLPRRARLLSALRQDQFPAQALAAEPVRRLGRSRDGARHRLGRPRQAPGEHHFPKLELVRLTIPRRVYTQAHMDVTAESVLAVWDERARACAGLKMVYEPKYLRFFQARFGWSPRIAWSAPCLKTEG